MGARTIKHHLAALGARLAGRPPLSAAELRGLRPRTLLVVRQQNQMGDMVCATPALRAVREAWPAARIRLVTAPVNVEVVRHNPHVDEVITFDRRVWRRPGRLAAFVRELRAPRPELALVLASVSFSVTSAAIALASGARWVVGPDSRPFGWDVSRHAFSLELPSSGPVPDRHAVDHNLAPLEAVGLATGDRATVVVPSGRERELAARVLADLDLEPGFWALHPGAGKAQNAWPVERFAAVARRVRESGRCALVLRGPADGAAVAALRAALGGESKVAAAPVLPVGAVAALLQAADRFLCNDTGVMHVAAAVGVPTLALFGPTDPALWLPRGDHVRALRSPGRRDDPRGPEYGWMETLAVEDVWRAWTALPERTAAGRE